VNNVVVVKGEASSTHHASQHALDSGTFLVYYEDRKVLGSPSALVDSLRSFAQIHDTFGPTYQPIYQGKFQQRTPPELERGACVGESDASNVHDEEPAAYELEFSVDEAEAAHNARLREVQVWPSSPEAVGVWAGRGTSWIAVSLPASLHDGVIGNACTHDTVSVRPKGYCEGNCNTQPYVSQAHQKSVLSFVGLKVIYTS